MECTCLVNEMRFVRINQSAELTDYHETITNILYIPCGLKIQTKLVFSLVKLFVGNGTMSTHISCSYSRLLQDCLPPYFVYYKAYFLD